MCPKQALAGSLDRAVRPDDAYFNKLVRIMATRCMTQAAYFGSGEVTPAEYYHYGLAAPLYTHFTSPIRRCALRAQHGHENTELWSQTNQTATVEGLCRGCSLPILLRAAALA